MATGMFPTATAALCYLVLDGLWLGFVMSSYYRTQLASIGRIEQGRFVPNWWAAVAVYVLLGAGLTLLALPRASNLAGAARAGACFGLVVYGVYDFTNVATLKSYPLQLALVDVAWGIVASAAAAAAGWMVAR